MKGKFWRKALAAALALLIVSGGVPIQPLSQMFDRTAITAEAATEQTVSYTFSYDSSTYNWLNGSDGSSFNIGSISGNNRTKKITAEFSKATIDIEAGNSINISAVNNKPADADWDIELSGQEYDFTVTPKSGYVKSITVYGIANPSYYSNFVVSETSYSNTLHWNKYYQNNSSIGQKAGKIVIVYTDTPPVSTYNINYELNGGTNASSNPATYDDDKAVTLAKPTRTGYTFGGWYDNASFSGSPVTSIPAGSSGDKTFYAKWISEDDFAKNGDTYTIKTETGWGVFCDCLQDSSYDGFSGKTVVLDKDITVTEMAGNRENPFKGTFDGGKHTITADISGSTMGVAVFSGINTATIKDLTLSGSITGGQHCGALVGLADGTNTIENVNVTADVRLDSSISAGQAHHGGVIGHALSSNTTLRGVVYSGTISSTSASNYVYVGGLVGWADDATITIENSLFAGTYNGGTLFHPILCKTGDKTVNGTFTNVYYTTAPTATNTNYYVANAGKTTHTITAGESVTIDYGTATKTYDVSGITAYGTGLAYGGSFYAGEGDEVALSLDNTAPEGYTFKGYSVNAGTLADGTLTMPNADVTITADIAITASAESTITPVTPQLDSDGFYSIGSAEELYGFAELVNSGNASTNAKLTADIVVNENVLDANGEANTGDFVQWTPIGNDYFEGKVYSGTFDGQGHTISGLYVSGNGWFVGFVGQVSGTAVVKNLGIVDSYFSSSNNNLGSIVGGVAEKSSVTIANVYSTSTVKGDNWIGGLVGGGGNGSVTIINSYFAGKTSTGWSYDTHHDDLVAGYFDRSTLTVCNAFVLGTSQYGTSVTAEQLSDGTVAAALHYYQDALADGSMFGLSGGKTNFSGTIDGVSVTTANITLHTFDGDATAYSSKYIVGNTTPLPVMVEREGYTFFGWYDNADLEGDAVTSISSSETGNKEYWAKFERSHAVSFVLGGGTIRSGEIDHYIEGETTALPTFVLKNGASFEGWYTTENFTGSRYYSIPATATEDMTFYAKWGAEKTTFYLGQGPEPVSILYEGENMVWLDKTTMERYVIFDNFRNYWGSNPGINVPYTGEESTFGYNRSELSVAQSGFYVFTLTDMGDESWFMSILKSMLNCDVASIPTQVYTGSAIEPAVTVKDGETTLTLGTDYEVAYSDNTNAGTAKATITGKGNYSGTVEKTFAIKATPTVTAPTANILTYNGNEQELVTAGSTDFGTVLYSLDGTNYSKDIPKATDAGKYTVYYKVDTDNYYYAPQTVEVTIAESYTITWKNGDETLETDNYVPGGATPEYNGETPTKADDTMYSYSFAGWSPNVSAVSENAEYTATFTSTPKTYNVTYKVDGVIYGDVDTVAYGTALTARDVPARDGYIFSGWSEIPETMPDHDIEITGTFSVDENYGKLNVADYKSGDTWTAPTQEGKVFAGWFADSEYTTPYMETTGYAYAKFIDERCITVKWQKRLDNPDSNKTDIRLVSTLDCGDYDSLHFVLTFTDNGFVIKDGQITRLYDSLTGFVDGESVAYTPDIFCEDSKYFAAYTVTGMPNSLSETSLTAQVYIITLDGTRVEGAPLTFKVADDKSNNG